MRYGHFDDANREYVIERPDTLRSWSNYIGARLFGGVITNNAGGYSFYRSSGVGRFTRLNFNAIPMEQPGRYFYLRDRDGGDYWSASWQPVGKPLDRYQSTCRFGTGYAVIDSVYDHIRSATTYFVPLGQDFECWRLVLTNEDTKPRRLSVFPYVEFTSEWHIFQDAFNLQYSMYIARTRWQDGFVQCSINEHLPEDPENFKNRDQSRWSWLTLQGAEVVGHDLDRETFIGPYRSYRNPLTVESGECRNSLAYGNNGCAGLRADVDLAPGESRELVVLMGVGKAGAEGRRAVAEYANPVRLDAELACLKDHWHRRLDTLQVQTPDDDLNHMLNVWGSFNTLMTFYWCRAASLVYSGDGRDGFGYRDTVQDLLGVAHTIPDEVRERLELMLTGQESNGGAMPEIKPYAHDPGAMPPTPPELQRSDDMLWMFDSIPAYVAETGDLDFYRQTLPYSDRGKATILGHLRRALEFNLERSGAHGLPCDLHADWDDCIRMGFKGETVLVAFQVRHGLAVYADVARRIGLADEAAWADRERAALDNNLQRHAWDGEWFVRAFKDTGEPIGAACCEEGKIYHLVQSWAVMSGAATPEQARTAMNSVDRLLQTEYGCVCQAPAYSKAECKELRMVLMHTGEKENGGVFSHPQGWVVIANCLLGNGDRAWRAHRANLPSRFNDLAEIRRIEPYCYCQSTSGRESDREGMSHLPWLTGAASWSHYAATRHLLGLQAEIDGFRIDPCIPAAWPGFTARREFRGKTLEIEVRNPHGKCKGVRRLVVDGKLVEGNLVPLAMLKPTTHIVAEIAP